MNPLGWQETYLDALQTCPNGQIVTFPDSNERFFYHPVLYRKRLIELFNSHKLEAIELLNNGKSFRENLNQLFAIDVKLFNLLTSWSAPDDYWDGSSFDPRDVDKDSFDHDFYFNCEKFGDDHVKEYIPLKLIRISG